MKSLTRNEFERVLQSALELEVPYSHRILRGESSLGAKNLTPAAVLVLFAYLKDEITGILNQGPSLLFIRRAESVETHKGQMAFPGGLVDPEDQDEPITTALRETEEEVGISKKEVRLLGRLPMLITSTYFSVRPIVGVLNCPLEEVSLQINEAEIAEAIWIPLEDLRQPDVYREEQFRVGKVNYPIDVYQVHRYRIWGATGSMTKNLLDRLDYRLLASKVKEGRG